jgi:methylated-DNA-[protein]-cysteine S-methyltransferase
MPQEHKACYQSEIGLLEIVGTEVAITSVNFVEDISTAQVKVPVILEECVDQLDEYFRGVRKEFTLKLARQGTDFQKKVWQHLLEIPYGKTVSYLEIARTLGNEKTVRAVGGANGRNGISIIIPCHRVIGSNGDLTGYGGGLWRKAWLLQHEQSYSVGKQLPLL